jgi:hypothetical protein
VAISDARILDIDAEARTVRFRYRDYADASKKKTSTVRIETFIDRFRLHVLPPRFCKIRHYGFLSNATRKTAVARIRSLIGPVPDPPPKPDADGGEPAEAAPVPRCPHCGRDALLFVAEIPRPGRPRPRKPP